MWPAPPRPQRASRSSNARPPTRLCFRSQENWIRSAGFADSLSDRIGRRACGPRRRARNGRVGVRTRGRRRDCASDRKKIGYAALALLTLSATALVAAHVARAAAPATGESEFERAAADAIVLQIGRKLDTQRWLC